MIVLLTEIYNINIKRNNIFIKYDFDDFLHFLGLRGFIVDEYQTILKKT